MKLRLLAAATLAALALTAGQAAAQDVTSDKGKLSYGLGYRAGLELANVLASGEQLDLNSVIKGLQDAAARKDPAVPGEQLGAAIQALQGRMEGRARAQLEQRANENKTKGEAFLAQNRGKAGVKVQLQYGGSGTLLSSLRVRPAGDLFIAADESYIRESIVQPQAKKVAGFSSAVMPPFVMSDKKIDALIMYIKTLK